MRTVRVTNVFQNIFSAFLIAFELLSVQLAKIVKISDKMRIFAAGYAKHIIYHYGRNNTRNRIIM